MALGLCLLAVASALTAAHGAGIVHGPLNPTAIFIDPKRQIKIHDFGFGVLGPPPESEEARQALAEAKAILDRSCPDPARGQPFTNWWDTLHARFFVREAEALLGLASDKAAERDRERAERARERKIKALTDRITRAKERHDGLAEKAKETRDQARAAERTARQAAKEFERAEAAAGKAATAAGDALHTVDDLEAELASLQ